MESASNDKIYAALARAQAVGLAATKDGVNPFYRSKYATLGQILEVIRKPLADQGLAVVQEATSDIDRLTVSVTTRIIHESGQSIVTQPLSCELRPEYDKNGRELKPSAQQVGSHVTYLRRYSLCAALSIAIEDDDANAVSSIGGDGCPTMDNKPPPNQPPQPKPGQRARYKSAHTGETLDQPDAVERHKAAAQQPTQQPTQQPAQPQPQPAATTGTVIQNAELAAACAASNIHPKALEGYLRGTYGNPRIKSPMILGAMDINSLGETIVKALLTPGNWAMVTERIMASEENLPF